MGFDMNAFSLAGKKAIVTGGAKKTGLCYGMAVALHDAGAEIVILDANSQVENTVAELGGAKSGYHAVVANLLDLNDLSNGFQQAISALGGRLDILVNGAGLQYRCPAEEFPEDAWDRIMGSTSRAFFYEPAGWQGDAETGQGKNYQHRLHQFFHRPAEHAGVCLQQGRRQTIDHGALL